MYINLTERNYTPDDAHFAWKPQRLDANDFYDSLGNSPP